MKPALSIPKLPGKKATSFTLSMDVYQAARILGISISQVGEQRLREQIQARSEQQVRHIAAFSMLITGE
jgi:antitoxin CcdA